MRWPSPSSPQPVHLPAEMNRSLTVAALNGRSLTRRVLSAAGGDVSHLTKSPHRQITKSDRSLTVAAALISRRGRGWT